MRHNKKTPKKGTFRFSEKDRKRMKSYIYQLFRAMVLGIKFLKLVRKVH
jgi:hypothetical protein